MRRAVALAVVLLVVCNPASFGKKKKADSGAGTDNAALTPLGAVAMQAHGLNLEATEAGEDAHSTHSATQFVAGYDLKFREANHTTRDLNISYTVSNSAAQQQDATLQWFFIGQRAATGDLMIIEHGQKQVTIPPSGHVDDTLTSVKVKSGEVSHNGRVTNSGKRITGWVMRLVDPSGGAVIAQECSDSDTEDLTRDPDKVQQLNAGKGLH